MAKPKKYGTESFRITPEAPYDYYATAYVHIRKHSGTSPRRHIVFDKKIREPFDGHQHVVGSTTYARYIYQVNLWKEKNEWIPEDMDVDHKNDNALHDVLENLQLLSRVDNIKKRDIHRYKNSPLSDRMLATLRELLAEALSWPTIADRMGISPGYVRYLVATYCPEYTFEKTEIIHVDSVKRKLDAGLASRDIAHDYGVSRGTMDRFILKYLPSYGRDERTTKNSDIAITGLRAGKTLTAIGKEIGVTPEMVIYLLKQYHADEYQEWKREREEASSQKKAMAKQLVGEYLAQGYTQLKISSVTGIDSAQVNAIGQEHYPQHTEAARYAARLAKVRAMAQTDASAMSIVRECGCGKKLVRDIRAGII